MYSNVVTAIDKILRSYYVSTRAEHYVPTLSPEEIFAGALKPAVDRDI